MLRNQFGGKPVVVGYLRDDDDKQQIRITADVVRLLDLRTFLQEFNQRTELIGPFTLQLHACNDAQAWPHLISRHDRNLALDDPSLTQTL